MTVRPRNTKVSRSIVSSSEAALALASVSLRFHSSSANSSPPSRPITSEERTCAQQRGDDGLEHLIARGMPEGVVDRLQAIDVEHDQRAAGVIALDVGDRALQLALEAAPVGNIQQEVGVGGGLQLLDPRLAPGQFRSSAGGSSTRWSAAAAAGRAGGARPCGAARLFAPPQRFCGVLRPFEAVALVFFVMRLPCAGLLMKACRDSPRQDSPFLIPCHALDDARADPYNPAYVSGFPNRIDHMTAPIAIIMGSQSDWETMRHAAETLTALGVACEKRIVSAHRTPDRLFAFAKGAKAAGFKIIIAGAGGAAHLPGMAAALTELPVFGVPVESKALSGVDSLYSIVQMPAGVPVGTLAIGKAGAINAALLAASVLALNDPALATRLAAWRKQQTDAVEERPEGSA